MKAIRFRSNNDIAQNINYYLDKGWTVFSIVSDMSTSCGASYTQSFIVIFNKNGIEL